MLARRQCFRRSTVFAGLLCATLCAAVHSAPPTKAEEQANLIGKPVSLAVQPAMVELNGPRATQQLVVTGKYADGTVRDLTLLATLRADPAGLCELSGSWLTAKANGQAAIVIDAGGQSIRVPVTVK